MIALRGCFVWNLAGQHQLGSFIQPQASKIGCLGSGSCLHQTGSVDKANSSTAWNDIRYLNILDNWWILILLVWSLSLVVAFQLIFKHDDPFSQIFGWRHGFEQRIWGIKYSVFDLLYNRFCFTWFNVPYKEKCKRAIRNIFHSRLTQIN